MKYHKTLVNEALKKHPYLKCLKPYACYPLNWLMEKDGKLYEQLHDCKDKSLDEALLLVKQYSKINYCLHQFDYWPSIEDFTYSESIEADAYGLFTCLSEEALTRIREDLDKLRAYEERGDASLLVGNCFC